jgi:hypothetical protein
MGEKIPRSDRALAAIPIPISTALTPVCFAMSMATVTPTGPSAVVTVQYAAVTRPWSRPGVVS